jgi:hypothetical protein
MTDHPRHDQAHLEEGDLIRYLDGEMTTEERSHTAAHLLACARCQQEMEAVRGERESFGELVAGLEVPAMDASRRASSLAAIQRAAAARTTTPAVRDRRRSRYAMLRAAAVASVLVVSAAAVSPVRAVVMDIWSSITDRVERVARTAPETTPAETMVLSNATIGFVPTGDVFLLEVATLQAEGALVLGVGQGSSVTANAVGDAVDIVVLPSGLRIQNRPDAGANYAVNLPPHLREVRVRVGEAREIVYRMDDLSASWISVLDLTSEGAPGPGDSDAR